MSSKLRVGVVFGGRSVEHEVSIISAKSVMESVDRERFDIIPIGVTKNGRWLSADDSLRLLNGEKVSDGGLNLLAVGSESFRGLVAVEDPACSDSVKSMPPESSGALNGDFSRRRSSVDVIFPLIHGAYGEDGKLQGLLELADIPYVGSGPLSSALGMDKDIMKKLFALNDLPVLKCRTVYWHEWKKEKDTIIGSIIREIGIPLFVKPANTGSSVGISKVKDENGILGAVEEAFRYDNKIIAEKGINAREIECSVLGNDNPKASVPGEIVPCNEFYDYKAKYLDERSELLIPAPLSVQQIRSVQEIAVKAFKTLECSGMARVDCLFDKDTGSFYLNELNTIPGFTPISMYPKLWDASGISYRDLISSLIELAVERHRSGKRIETSYRPDII